MLLSHLAGVIARRWIIAVLGLLVTAGLAVGAVKAVPPEYSLTATVLLVPPVDNSEPGANPYLSLGGLTAPTEVLARAMSDPGTERTLRDQGASGTWTIERDYLTSAPILLVTTQNATVAQAQATSSVILKFLPTQLQTLQAAVNVPTTAMITSSVVNRDADQQKVLKPMIRAVMILIVLGLILTVGVAALVDALVSRRSAPPGRRRRSTLPPSSPDADPEPPPTRSAGRRRPASVRANGWTRDESVSRTAGSTNDRPIEAVDAAGVQAEPDADATPTLVRSGRGLRSR